MSRLVPTDWMPACRMRRVITHWTAGTHAASEADRDHYHLLIEGDGHLVRGYPSIADNVHTGDGDYAAHTRRCNTGSIGVAMCGMLNARREPFFRGPYPLTPCQYEVLAVVTADLCERYRIPVTPETVLAHGEVEDTLAVPQHGKWDPLVLPWAPETPAAVVAEAFRQRVRTLLLGDDPDPVAGSLDHLVPVRITLDGEPLTTEGILTDGASWCPLRPLADLLGWHVLQIDRRSAILWTGSSIQALPALIRAERGHVRLRDLASAMHWPAPKWEAAARTVHLGTKPASGGQNRPKPDTTG